MAVLLAGCGGSTGPTPPKPAVASVVSAAASFSVVGGFRPGDDGWPATCGYLTAGQYVAGSVQVARLTCPQTAAVLTRYLKGGLRPPAGWRVLSISAAAPAGPAPVGGSGVRSVVLANASTLARIWLWLGGSPTDSHAPPPFTFRSHDGYRFDTRGVLTD